MKKCPYCAEEIQDEAIKCRYCKEWIGEIQSIEASIVDSPERHFVSEDKEETDENTFSPDESILKLKEQISKKEEGEGKPQCPKCKKWDVEKLYLQDFSYGYYCHNCRQSLKSMGVVGVERTGSSIPTSALTHSFKKDPTNLTNTLKTMLWVFMGLVIISILSDFAELNLIKSGNINYVTAEANDTRQQVIGVIYIIAFIVTGITFLKWIYRANLNVRGFGVQNIKFTPGWSIGYYFIPILNLFKPYQAMKEIWQTSKSPANWQNQQGSPLLVWWWTLWLISSFLGQLLFRTAFRADTLADVSSATTISMIDGFINIALTAIAISLVSKIFNMQKDFVYSDAQFEQKEPEQVKVQLTEPPLKEREGKIQCPQCKEWDVYQTMLKDDGMGYYCPHCRKSLKTMASAINNHTTPSTSKKSPDLLIGCLAPIFFFIALALITLFYQFIAKILE